MQLHFDNLRVALAGSDSSLPSYPTIRRYLKAQGMFRQARPSATTEGALLARDRLERLEVRSFEVDHVSRPSGISISITRQTQGAGARRPLGQAAAARASSTTARGWSAICSGISTRPPRAWCMDCRRRS
jgi:hypothetical protein